MESQSALMPESQLLQISHDSAAIYSRKLVRRNGLADIVVSAFLSFTVKELEYRIVQTGRVERLHQQRPPKVACGESGAHRRSPP